MKYRTRTFYTDGQKALMWERWREGESLQKIAQLFDCQATSGTDPRISFACRPTSTAFQVALGSPARLCS
jgi:hypothetical protein